MVHGLKSGKTVVERIAANALDRRALLMKSMAVTGLLGAGAGLDMAKDVANAAQSIEGSPSGMQMWCSLMAPGPMARAGAKLSWASTPRA
jgi:hypothetical protein